MKCFLGNSFVWKRTYVCYKKCLYVISCSLRLFLFESGTRSKLTLLRIKRGNKHTLGRCITKHQVKKAIREPYPGLLSKWDKLERVTAPDIWSYRFIYERHRWIIDHNLYCFVTRNNTFKIRLATFKGIDILNAMFYSISVPTTHAPSVFSQSKSSEVRKILRQNVPIH